jgi:hypothetical protein
LAPDGQVVAIHRGGAKYWSGFAQAVPLWQIKSNLEAVLGVPSPPATDNAVKSTSVPRREVVVLQYQPTSESKVLGEFLGIFLQKITALPATFPFAENERLGDLSIRSTNDVLTATQALTRWRRNDASLVFMSGTIFANSTPREVTSSIYVGEHDRLFATERISTRIAVTPEQAISARDSHTVMLLYALAKDAYARRADNAIVASYLSEAQETVEDLALTEPQFKKLQAEISSTLAELKK